MHGIKSCSQRCPKKAHHAAFSGARLPGAAIRRLAGRDSFRRHAAESGSVPASGPVDLATFNAATPQALRMMADEFQSAGANFNLLAPQEVARLQAAGLPLVDVRTEGLFDAGHIPRAVNVPLFQPIDGWSPMQIARRVGYAAFGVFNGTEINPRFEQAISETVPDKAKGVILYCSVGGTLDPATPSKNGLQTRSMIAAFQLLRLGHCNVHVLSGGYQGWAAGGREVWVMEPVDE